MKDYQEKDFQKVFNVWAVENCKESTAYELKILKKGSFDFSDVKEHQLKGLHDFAYGKGLYYRIPDVGGKHGNKQMMKKPFDCFFVKYARAYIVILIYTGADYNHAVFIDVDTFIIIKSNYEIIKKRKSIKVDDLISRADFCVQFPTYIKNKRG